MKDAVLLELARRWELDAKEPVNVDGGPGAAEANAKAQGTRETLRGCADCLKMLISLIGDSRNAG